MSVQPDKAPVQGPRVLLCLARAEEALQLRDGLAAAGIVPTTCEAPFEWAGLLVGQDADAVVTDADEIARGLCEAAADRDDAPALVVLADFATAEDSVRALKRGVAEFLERPQTPEQIALAVERAARGRALRRENDRLRRDLGERFSLAGLVSRDASMARLSEIVSAVADTRTTVLISGESGTGKTLLARAMHLSSSRRERPFVEVNCGALPATLLESELFGHVRGAFTGATRDVIGRFEAAAGGTLFLDEIASAPLDLQVKLLRAIQDHAFERVGESTTRIVDTRVIAASNRDLEQEVRAGRFREDLFWRLNVIHLRIPPLRERRGDVLPLAEHFLELHARRHGRPAARLAPEALAALIGHDWPGNVRELENCLERAILLARGPRLEPADLGFDAEVHPRARATTASAPPGPVPAGVAPMAEAQVPLAALPRRGEAAPVSLRAALESPERELVERALALAGGHRQRAAALLGVTRSTLFNKMRKYGLLERPTGSPSVPGESGAPSGPRARGAEAGQRGGADAG